MNWRLVHVWLRGYSDALRGVDRRHCYGLTSEAVEHYERGHAVGFVEAYTREIVLLHG